MYSTVQLARRLVGTSIHVCPAGQAVLIHYPKSGATWLRSMMLAAMLGRPATARELPRLSAPIGPLPWQWRRSLLPHSHYTPTSGGRVRRSQVCTVALVRDPLDVFASYADYAARGSSRLSSDELIDAIRNGVGRYGTWRAHALWAARSADLLVRYEDLCRDPSVFLNEYFERIGDHEALEHVEMAIESNTAERTRVALLDSDVLRDQNWADPARFVHRAGPDRWRGTLCENERQLIVDLHGAAARELGYELDSSP